MSYVCMSQKANIVFRLEEEFLLKRSGSEISTGDGSSEGGSRRGTIRRSLKFIRRSSRSSQHQRTPSKESRDLIDADLLTLIDDLYQRVERLDCQSFSPFLSRRAAVGGRLQTRGSVRC